MKLCNTLYNTLSFWLSIKIRYKLPLDSTLVVIVPYHYFKRERTLFFTILNTSHEVEMFLWIFLVWLFLVVEFVAKDKTRMVLFMFYS